MRAPSQARYDAPTMRSASYRNGQVLSTDPAPSAEATMSVLLPKNVPAIARRATFTPCCAAMAMHSMELGPGSATSTAAAMV